MLEDLSGSPLLEPRRRQHFLPPNPPSMYPLADTVYSTDRDGSHTVPLPEGWGNDSEQGLTFPAIYSLLRAMNKNYNGQRKVLFRKMANGNAGASKDIQGEEGQDGSFEWVVRKSPLRR